MATIPYGGEQAVKLESTHLQVIILPNRGGKIASIKYLNQSVKPKNDRNVHNHWQELLIQPEGTELPPLTPGTFGFAQSWGWDDMFPSIASGPYPFEGFRNTHLPDHGEFWYLPAQTIKHQDKSVTMEFEGKVLPYHMTRSVLVQDNVLKLTWTLKNSSNKRLYYFWAAHPLFDVAEDCVLSGPAEQGESTIINAFDHPTLPGYAREYSYPIAQITNQAKSKPQVTSQHLNRMPPKTTPGAMKYYINRPLTEHEQPLILSQPSRNLTLQLLYDHHFLPYLGMWINGNGWGEQYTMAPEPATGIMDSLHAAKDYHTAAHIDPDTTQSWWMELSLNKM